MFCPDCGLDNRETAKFCANCGFRLAGGGSSSSAGKSNSANPRASGKKPARKSIAPKPVSTPPPAPQPAYSGYSLPSGTLSVGSMLDRRYKIIQHVATGGMGAIYKGEDTRLRTTVAVKEMLDFFQNHDDRKYAIQRFQEEALLLADLRHPNIPRVTDHFIENNRYYLIMDFVEGKSTEKILQENRNMGLPIEPIIKWAIQICDVLYYLHSRKPPIIYRDMKPSNIMIKNDDTVMLVDFGIARHFNPRRPGTMIGTHGYAPPEQYKGNTEPRSDLYALASTLHHLLTGNDPTQGVPFKFKPLRELRPDIPYQLENVIDKALQNLVEMRFVNGLEMKRAFESLDVKYSGGKTSSQQSSPSRPKAPGGSSNSQYMRPVKVSGMPSPPSYNQEKKNSPVIDAQEHFTRAKNHIEMGRYNRGKRELEKALKLSPYYPEAHSLMGYILIKKGLVKDAINHLNQALALQPGSATAHLYLGKAYARLGQFDKSQQEYRIAGNLDPKILEKNDGSFIEKLIRSFLT